MHILLKECEVDHELFLEFRVLMLLIQFSGTFRWVYAIFLDLIKNRISLEAPRMSLTRIPPGLFRLRDSNMTSSSNLNSAYLYKTYFVVLSRIWKQVFCFYEFLNYHFSCLCVVALWCLHIWIYIFNDDWRYREKAFWLFYVTENIENDMNALHLCKVVFKHFDIKC